MKAVDIPVKFPIPFGDSAGGDKRQVPTDSQIGITDGAASLETGYPPLNFLPQSAGGVGPFGQDVNGIQFQSTSWDRWFSAGGPIAHDSAFASDISGYPKGAVVSSDVFGQFWISSVDDNATDPDAAGDGWVGFAPAATATTSTGASTTYTRLMAGLQVLRSNSGSAMGDVLPGTSPGVLPLGTRIKVTNADTAGMLSIKAGTGAAIEGIVGNFVYLGPGQSAEFLSDGSNYWPTSLPTRARLGANTSIFVATTGSNTTNDGLTVSTPMLTQQAAWNLALAQFDLAGFTFKIKCADGSYTTALNINGPLVGQGSYSSVIIEGNVASTSSCAFSTVASCITVNGGQALIQGFAVAASGGGNRGIVAANGGVAAIASMEFRTCAGGHVLSIYNGTVVFAGACSITAGAPTFIEVSDGASAYNSASLTISQVGVPAFTTAYASASKASMTFSGGVTFDGTATGSRYKANLNGVIDTTGGGANFFPGNSAGTTATGGQYA